MEQATTDADVGFTVTEPSIAVGSHTIDFSYLGDEMIEPSDDSVSITLADDTTMTTDAVGRMIAGEDIELIGHLETAKGDPIPDATITATDTVDGTTTNQAEATTTAGAISPSRLQARPSASIRSTSRTPARDPTSR